ncbi:MAG: NfeD family protein [Actinomycetota bacterium]
MCRALVVSLLVGVLAPAAQPAAGAQPEAPARVIVAEIDGSIDRTLAGYLLDTLAEGERTGATVVLQLDTAGTLDQDAVGLARQVFESKVPVISWVGPAPAKAQGAGLLFMYASSLAAVSPGAGVGPLQPLDLVDARSRIDEATLEDLMLGWAAERGKPVVDVPSSPLPAQDALDRHIAQVVAPSIPDLLEEVDRSTVETAAGPVTLRTRIAQSRSETPVDVRFTEPGPVDRVLHAAASPAAIYVLLVLGFAALTFELVQPGFGFAGLAGLSMLALGAYGLTAVPASWLGLLLLVGGVLFLTADVLLRRLSALTALGLAAFLAGSVLAFRDVAPAIRVSPWLVGSLTVGSFLYYGFALTVALQSRERITSTHRGLVGLVGETRGELRPEGPEYVKGSLWRGRSSDGPIPAGTRVRIRGVDGLILRVEPEPGPEGGPPARD